MELGEVTEATVASLGAEDQAADQTLDLEDVPWIRRVSQNNSNEWRTEQVRTLFHPSLNLDASERENFCQTLEQCHQAFCLEDNERGETDLVQLEIDTGDSPPQTTTTQKDSLRAQRRGCKTNQKHARGRGYPTIKQSMGKSRRTREKKGW